MHKIGDLVLCRSYGIGVIVRIDEHQMNKKGQYPYVVEWTDGDALKTKNGYGFYDSGEITELKKYLEEELKWTREPS